MKNKLLITTALVAVGFAANVYATDLIVSAGDDIKNPATGREDIDAIQNDGVQAYHYDSIIVSGGKLTIDNFKIRSDNDATISGGEVNVKGTNPEQHGGIRAHNGTLNISGGVITATQTEIHGGVTNVSGDAVININDGTEFGGDSELHISGGTLNLSKGIVVVSPVDDLPEEKAQFEMTGGVINMEDSYLGSSKILNDSETERVAGTSKLSGGIINVNKGNNTFLMDNADVQNTINIANDAILEVWKGYRDAEDVPEISSLGVGTLNLINGGSINLSGTLVANISGDDRGVINFESSEAVVEGDVDTPSLTFN
ncbi:MAG: hypothetical protein J6J35_04345, partial [Alphaproteobacteria bacterium]|nr:hypothetical protein [Alphaproteobacteria bacterium]